MEHSPLPAAPESLLPELDALLEEAREYARRSKGAGTLRLYRREWAAFEGWCAERRLSSLPAAVETAAAYVALLARGEKATSTINVAVAAISQAHQAAGFPSPTHDVAFRAVWRGVRRERGVAPRLQKSAATLGVVKEMLAELPQGAFGVRDRALILFAFATAMRRSELVALDVADVRRVERGLEVTIRRSKTDPLGEGRKIAVSHGKNGTCPVAALSAWLETAGISEGPIFRGLDRGGRPRAGRMDPGSVGRILKRAMSRTGLVGEELRAWGGHSTRAGHITEAARRGLSEAAIARTSGHTSNVLRTYIRNATLFDDASSASLGL